MDAAPINATAVDRYTDELTRFLRSRLSDPMAVEDLLQELWYRWTRTVQQQSLQDERAWLYRVARHLIIDHYRRSAPLWLEEWLLDDEDESPELDRSPILAADASPEELLWQAQFWEALYEGLEALPPKQREVFVQNEFDGLTLREIAEAQHAPLKTIISRKGYAMRRLREHLQAFFDDLEEGEGGGM
jgi:RNA polymerase sigma factor (sigma-70 family)